VEATTSSVPALLRWHNTCGPFETFASTMTGG